MATETVAKPRTSARVGVQKFGTFLSGMIMPNIGAFIAWGLITALFIEKGWIPVPELGGYGTNAEGVANVGLVGPMVNYLLPLLIAYTGGRMVYDVRGGVVGAIATMGVIVGTGIPMFIGAMIMGPLGGWTMKKIDSIWDGKIRPGFEMLVNNFSAGIWGGILTLLGFYGLTPVVKAFTAGAGSVVQFLVDNGLLPLTSIFIEPAKVLFLNNAINHGVLTPLGIQQSLDQGKSILFLLEANPGPGLGILLAYMFFGRGAARASAPGAAIIHFLGGIHEIYFPYVLMKPILILAAIGGGMTGIATLAITNSGLVAPAAPGSIIAVIAQTSRDSYVGVVLAVVLATTVSFLIASLILRTSKNKGDDDLSEATSRMEAMKGKKSSVSSALVGDRQAAQGEGTVLTRPVRNIVFACDAGMGSSAMGASVLRNKIKAAGFPDVKVTNSAIANLSDTYDVVVTHQDLTERAQPRTSSAVHYSVDNFMNSPRYDEIVDLVRSSNSADAPAAAAPSGAVEEAPAHGAHAAEPAAAVEGKGVLLRESVILNGTSRDRDSAIDEAGKLLLDRGAVDVSYVHAMHEREESVSTYMGSFLAIPHGTNDAKEHINHSAVSIIRYPEGIDWGGKQVKFVVGVAGINNEHLHILSSIAKIFTNKAQVAQLEQATTVDEVLELFGKVNA
ncbi:PTS mannose transporter subunit IIA [Arthrobacter sp. StoSoilB3]|jgi:PTS system mannitol-specific IIC component|uniref:PTS mannitol transporter subunit IICBA n=1 Tax=Paenarthrobacter TaxID=1742992 RepID=UPI00057CDEBD|nr:PTS mannitol transporter subunit IICBA [Paenarthrobacter nicotinovorans]KIA71199.1 PTS system mannitol-specific transporter subunit IICBA [Arthrobacter sp. MWB30]KQR01970.1 PTS mannose transporter subunit IIA [Arthrobacter sp. Leaf145]BCW12500.1 PTS mannose transporter subunit IIA [Arthrobacter sp. NtRootA2]BCW16583.1 PTS mannose transporter subunit IIA [Arthrobacter sp. NtRootA4]BCW24916.1 PTS mannose transporter subunit IIA [Arthrobacter sp. NtRootC7]BCW29185.1 PTS mannose transporter su